MALKPFQLSEQEAEIAWAALLYLVRKESAAMDNLRPTQRRQAEDLLGRLTSYFEPPQEASPQKPNPLARAARPRAVRRS